MRAALDDFAVAHDEDHVGVPDRRKPVRDDEAGLVRHQRAHRLLDALLGARVDVRGRLVEDQERGVEQHRARDRHQLLLALRDVRAVVVEHGVVALGQRHDVLVDAARPADALHVGARGRLAAVGDVFKHRAAEQPGVLQDHRVIEPQAPARQVAHRAAVQPDLAAVHVVKAHEQIDDRRLAGARRADDRDQRALRHVERKVLDDLPVGRIAEIDVRKLDLAADGLEVDGVRRVGRLRRLVEQAEHALRRRKGGLQLADDVGDLVDRAAELSRVQHEGRDVADRDRAAEVQNRAEKADERERKVVDEVDRGADQAAVIVGLVVRLDGLVVLAVELFDRVLLLAVGAQRLLPADHLLDEAVQLAELRGAFAEQRARKAGDLFREQERKRDRHDEHEHEHRRDRQHHGERADDRHDAREDLHDVVRERGVDRVDIIGNAAQDVAGLVRVEVADRQLGELVEHVAPHRVDDPAADDDHEPCQRVGQHGRGDVQEHHQDRIKTDAREIDPAGAELHRVDRKAGDVRAREREQVAADAQQNAGDKQHFVAQQVRQQAREDRGLFHLGFLFHASTPSPPTDSGRRSPICESPISR